MERRLINVYVNALYKSASDIEHVEQITESLKQFDEAMHDIPDFRRTLLSKSVSPSVKLNLIKSLESSLSGEVINLFCLIIKKSRYFIFPNLLEVWTERLKSIYNIRRTEIITAFEADESTKKNIDLYLKSVDPDGAHIKTYLVDPSIIGGFRVIVGNIIYDNSFEGKLSRLKKKML